MRRILTSLFLLICSFLAAQSFQGMAVYESKTSTSEMASSFRGNREVTPEMQKMIEERMKAMFEKTFILTFDRNASTYAEEEKIDATGQQGGMRFMSSMMGGGGTHYKNVKEKIFMVDKEFAGKEFLIQDSLPKLDWKLTGETKQIGNYMCMLVNLILEIIEDEMMLIKKKRRLKKIKKRNAELI